MKRFILILALLAGLILTADASRRRLLLAKVYDLGASCNTLAQGFTTVNGINGSTALYYATPWVSDGQPLCAVAINAAVDAGEVNSFIEIRSNSSTNRPSTTILASSSPRTAAEYGTGTNMNVIHGLSATVTPASGDTNWIVWVKSSATGTGRTWGRASGGLNLLVASADGTNWFDVTTTRNGNYQFYKP